ncbi:MAG: hypothetical protein JSV02_05210 [Dehalococcoidia bacterium]|nr:MAG: hypothetical protein JSV02_05210 [Dehalococcoidia bacterium]
MTSDGSADSNMYPVNDNEAVQHLKGAIAGGKPWHIALLEAMALWVWPEEERKGQCYHYLIDGEAFDWLLLAGRLSEEVADDIPEDELVDLLFYGRMPGEVTDEMFRRMIGPAKYHAYLNYLYGVVVEKFVLIAVEEEIRKERHSHVFSKQGDGQDDSYTRVYGISQGDLLEQFRQERGYNDEKDMDLDRLQEFTYWLFKYRIEHCDKARVASDTRKGVEYLMRHRREGGLNIPERSPQNTIEHGL